MVVGGVGIGMESRDPRRCRILLRLGSVGVGLAGVLGAVRQVKIPEMVAPSGILWVRGWTRFHVEYA